jgi:hypothetical protein
MGTAMLLAAQLVGVAKAPLNATVLVLWDVPKFVPEMVTEVPTWLVAGFIPVMFGAGVVTMKLAPLLGCPFTVTVTLPVEAPVGTEATILVAVQAFDAAGVPSKLTTLVPWVDPKLVPEIVMDVPNGPEVGEMPVIEGPEELSAPVPLSEMP